MSNASRRASRNFNQTPTKRTKTTSSLPPPRSSTRARPPVRSLLFTRSSAVRVGKKRACVFRKSEQGIFAHSVCCGSWDLREPTVGPKDYSIKQISSSRSPFRSIVWFIQCKRIFDDAIRACGWDCRRRRASSEGWAKDGRFSFPLRPASCGGDSLRGDSFAAGGRFRSIGTSEWRSDWGPRARSRSAAAGSVDDDEADGSESRANSREDCR